MEAKLEKNERDCALKACEIFEYDQVSVSGPSLRTNAEKNIKELKERVMTDINVSKVA